MNDTLLVPIPGNATERWNGTEGPAEYSARVEQDRQTLILKQLPTAERLTAERAKLEKAEAELAAKEAEQIAKLQKLESHNDRRKSVLRELETGAYLFAESEAVAGGNTLDLCFSGHHTNPQYQGYWGLSAIATIELAAAHAVKKYPAWLAAKQAELATVEEALIAAARELKLTDKLPEELRARAK